jgi:hypothetical protein
MGVILKIVSGPRAGATVAVPEGGVVRFGRSDQADCALPEDSFLSGLHFAVGCRQGRAVVSDLGSMNGTFINGVRIQKAPLNEKDRLEAGHSTFQLQPEQKIPTAAVAATVAAVAVGAVVVGAVAVGAAAGASEPDAKAGHRAPLSVIEKALVEFLGKQPEPVYAVLDAACDPFVLPVIQAFAEEYRSLYEGEAAQDLADCAPYLARVTPGSRFAEELSHGWGRNWGIYLTCGQSLEEIRKHLRHFLTVDTEQGKRLLFRFYDPRALRMFLPTCNVGEVHQFFGPVGSFLIEEESPECVLRFRAGATGAEREVVALAKPSSSK